jgi:dihydroneopterin triphosphate aldolase (PTPS-III) / 6-pyruvoyltetrahydropterin synthase
MKRSREENEMVGVGKCVNNDKADEFDIFVSKDSFKFNAAHFIAYKGFRERLHGHNYRVSVRMRGSRIGHDGYVIDFGVIKSCVKSICKSMNEHFILPARSDAIRIEYDDSNAKLTCEDGAKFHIPLSDCLVLPIVHSSVEEISSYILGKLLSRVGLDELKRRGIRIVELSVSEAPGQEATIRRYLYGSHSDQDKNTSSSSTTGKPRTCLSNVLTASTTTTTTTTTKKSK